MSEVYKIQVNDSEPIEVSQQVYEVSFCFNEMLKEKDKEIERLNNIINKKEQFLGDNIKRLEREVVKRDNIINELEKWLRSEIKRIEELQNPAKSKVKPYGEEYNNYTLIIGAYDNVLDKLQELKGSDK